MTPIIGPRHTNTSMADRDRIVAETQARAHQAALADAADGDPGETNEPPVLRNREPVREHQQAARTDSRG